MKVIFESLDQSVEMTAKVCTDAKVTGAEGFADRLWNLGHKTPFEHNTVEFKPKDAKEQDSWNQLVKLVRLARSTHAYQPAFRIVERAGFALHLIGSYRAFMDTGLISPKSLHWYTGEGARITHYIETNIGVAREILRHREFSFTERSTRYVKKFVPKMTRPTTSVTPIWSEAMSIIETAKSNSVPRDVYREALPLMTGTAFYMTGWPDSFPHFLELRLDSAAHEGARIVAEEVKRGL